MNGDFPGFDQYPIANLLLQTVSIPLKRNIRGLTMHKTLWLIYSMENGKAGDPLLLLLPIAANGCAGTGVMESLPSAERLLHETPRARRIEAYPIFGSCYIENKGENRLWLGYDDPHFDVLN